MCSHTFNSMWEWFFALCGKSQSPLQTSFTGYTSSCPLPRGHSCFWLCPLTMSLFLRSHHPKSGGICVRMFVLCAYVCMCVCQFPNAQILNQWAFMGSTQLYAQGHSSLVTNSLNKGWGNISVLSKNRSTSNIKMLKQNNL